MNKFLSIVSLCVLCAGVSCAQPFKNSQNANTAPVEDKAASAVNAEQDIDCEQLMRDMSEDCYASSSVDENNNPLPESELIWVSNYCECYAQLSFQSFGCVDVAAHQNLSEDEFQRTYANIFNECEQQENQIMQDRMNDVAVNDIALVPDEQDQGASEMPDNTPKAPDPNVVEGQQAPANNGEI